MWRYTTQREAQTGYINTNWLSGAPLDEWQGVYTDANGRVIELWLSRNGLTGEIPPELGALSNLEWLYLSDNELSGEIQPELGQLSNLELLYLDGNEFTECVPGALRDVNRTTLRSWSCSSADACQFSVESSA